MGIDGGFSSNVIINLVKASGAKKREEVTIDSLKELKKRADKKLEEMLSDMSDEHFWGYSFDEEEGTGIQLVNTQYWTSVTLVVAELLIILKEAYSMDMCIDLACARTTYEDDFSAGCMKIGDVERKDVQISFFDTYTENIMENGKVGNLVIFSFKDLIAGQKHRKGLIDYCIYKKRTDVFAHVD